MLHTFFSVICSVILTAHLLHYPPSANPAKIPDVVSGQPTDSFDIIHYTINLTIPDFTSGTIAGITDIQLTSLSDSLENITLQLKHLHVDSIWIDEVSVPGFIQQDDFLTIHLVEPLTEGTTNILTIFYHGKPVKDPNWGGVYFTHNTVFVMGVCMSFDPPSCGRLWYPCIDNLKEKASYDYFITVSDTLSVVCPGILKEVFPIRKHTKTYHWSLDLPISTYLSAFAVSNYAILYDTLKGRSRKIPVVYYVQKKDTLKAQQRFSHVPLYLSTFESLFIPYPWPKIGYVGVPFKGGAMEHATAIFIPEMIINNTTGDEEILIHEFAHNWFGNLVTCAADTDMWLNEGFASYCVPLYYEATQGEKAYQEYIRHLHKNVLQYTHIRDKGYYAVSRVPLPLTYGSTVYDKGADMIHNLRSYLGDKLFFEALQEYLKTYAFGNVSTSEFEKFLSAFTRTSMDECFDTWINTPGFPHFSISSDTIEREHDGFKCLIQVRQQLVGRHELSYRIPLEITFMDSLWNEETHKIYFSGKDERITLHSNIRPDLIMLNKNEAIHDATTSTFRVLKAHGKSSFPDCFLNLSVDQITDSVFFRVVHHWIPPDNLEESGMSPFQHQYWSIETIGNKDFSAEATFSYQIPSASHQKTIPQPLSDEVLLLYRASPDKKWEPIQATVTGNTQRGQAVVSGILPGEYCLAQSGK